MPRQEKEEDRELRDPGNNARGKRSPFERAVIAAGLKMARRLLRKHPLIAAELLVTGLSEGGKVGVTEIRDMLRSRKLRKHATSKV